MKISSIAGDTFAFPSAPSHLMCFWTTITSEFARLVVFGIQMERYARTQQDNGCRRYISFLYFVWPTVMRSICRCVLGSFNTHPNFAWILNIYLRLTESCDWNRSWGLSSRNWCEGRVTFVLVEPKQEQTRTKVFQVPTDMAQNGRQYSTE